MGCEHREWVAAYETPGDKPSFGVKGIIK